MFISGQRPPVWLGGYMCFWLSICLSNISSRKKVIVILNLQLSKKIMIIIKWNPELSSKQLWYVWAQNILTHAFLSHFQNKSCIYYWPSSTTTPFRHFSSLPENFRVNNCGMYDSFWKWLKNTRARVLETANKDCPLSPLLEIPQASPTDMPQGA